MRKKRYEKIKDLNELKLQVLNDLMMDHEGHVGILVFKYYTITTNGGDQILWQLNEKDKSYWTVSTGKLKVIHSYVGRGKNLELPVYGHYILTDFGKQWLQDLMFEQSLVIQS